MERAFKRCIDGIQEGNLEKLQYLEDPVVFQFELGQIEYLRRNRELREENARQKAELGERAAKIRDLEAAVAEKGAEAEALRRQIAELRAKIESLEQSVQVEKDIIIEKEREAKVLEERIEEMREKQRIFQEMQAETEKLANLNVSAPLTQAKGGGRAPAKGGPRGPSRTAARRSRAPAGANQPKGGRGPGHGLGKPEPAETKPGEGGGLPATQEQAREKAAQARQGEGKDRRAGGGEDRAGGGARGRAAQAKEGTLFPEGERKGEPRGPAFAANRAHRWADQTPSRRCCREAASSLRSSTSAARFR